MHIESDATSRFVKGALFAWVPLLFFIVPTVVSILRTIVPQKATGIGAVAGGLSEALVTFGLVAMVGCEVYAVYLLAGTFAKGQLFRGFFAAVSIGCGTLLVLALSALLVWFSRSGSMR